MSTDNNGDFQDEIFEPEDDFAEPEFDVDDVVEPEEGLDFDDVSATDVEPFTGNALTDSQSGDISITHAEGTTVKVVHLDDNGEENSQIVDLASPPLNAEEAEKITSNIRTQANVLYLLIARAHAGKAHLALGYTSFEQYVKEEFNYSKSYAYKLINQANVIDAIEEVMPEGAQVYVSDATARGLKTSLGEFIPELEQRLTDNPENEANEVVEDLIQEYRDRRNEPAEDDDEADFGGEHPAGGGNGDGEYEYEYDFDEDDNFEDDDAGFGDEDPAVMRRKIEAVYNLYTTLAQFSQMPPSSEIIEMIPRERRPQVSAYLESAISWLGDFKTVWDEALAEDDTDDEESDSDDSSLDNSEEEEDF